MGGVAEKGEFARFIKGVPLNIAQRGKKRRRAAARRTSVVPSNHDFFFCQHKRKSVKKVSRFLLFPLRRMGGEKKEDEFGAFFKRGSPKMRQRRRKRCRGHSPNIVVVLKSRQIAAVSFGEICVSIGGFYVQHDRLRQGGIQAGRHRTDGIDQDGEQPLSGRLGQEPENFQRL